MSTKQLLLQTPNQDFRINFPSTESDDFPIALLVPLFTEFFKNHQASFRLSVFRGDQLYITLSPDENPDINFQGHVIDDSSIEYFIPDGDDNLTGLYNWLEGELIDDNVQPKLDEVSALKFQLCPNSAWKLFKIAPGQQSVFLGERDVTPLPKTLIDETFSCAAMAFDVFSKTFTFEQIECFPADDFDPTPAKGVVFSFVREIV